MQLLAIETSSDACSVALYQNGAILAREAIIPQQHSQQLLPMVTVLLAEAESSLTACDAIAFGRGPGSFTGVRMAAGVAQGLAFGLDIPVIPVSTLAAIAWAARTSNPEGYLLATLDARMQQLYWAVYQVSAVTGVQEVQGEHLHSYYELVKFLTASDFKPLVICGPGWSAYAHQEETRWHCATQALPSACSIAELAALNWHARLNPADALPSYVRDNVAVVPTKKMA